MQMSSDRDLEKRIAENVAHVRSRMEAAALKSGRSANDVRLIAVTKYVGLRETQAVIAAGCRELGESRPQDLWEKAAALSSAGIQWHLIGHLQRNKVRRTLPAVALIHSVDSERLLREIDNEASKLALVANVLLEINVSGDAAKDGFRPDDVASFLERAAAFQNVAIKGLMAMSGLESNDEQTRREFALLRELRDRWQSICPPSVALRELSMGMSGDFETAIEEGATIVRIGSSLFEGVRE